MSSCRCVSEEHGPRTVYVEHLALTDFRSWQSLHVDLDSRPIVLSGANGSGKTNILEALSFLAPGRGCAVHDSMKLQHVIKSLGAWGL